MMVSRLAGKDNTLKNFCRSENKLKRQLCAMNDLFRNDVSLKVGQYFSMFAVSSTPL